MVEEIKEKFTGTWKMDRSEHFEEFMSAMGETNRINSYFTLQKGACLLEMDGESIDLFGCAERNHTLYSLVACCVCVCVLSLIHI